MRLAGSQALQWVEEWIQQAFPAVGGLDLTRLLRYQGYPR